MKKLEVYKCELCGNIVSVNHVGGGTLSCCGSPMVHVSENTTDAAQEKHVPVIQKVEGGYKVSVGSVAHPMDAGHYIQWIELQAGRGSFMAYLEPGQLPEATFLTGADNVSARAFCNLHSLWKA